MGARALSSYGSLPLSFEPNLGQSDSRAKYLVHASGSTIFLTASDTVLKLVQRSPRATPATLHALEAGVPVQTAPISGTVLRMHYVGANADPQVAGLDPLPGTATYFIGRDPKNWRMAIPPYARVTFRNVYPGVDLAYHGTQGHLESDWTLAPGADPGRITFSISGAQGHHVDGAAI